MPEKDEILKNISDISGKILKKIKKNGSELLTKIDETYNKLPLDKINEKLRGKVDVRSQKFKRVAGISSAAILLFLLVICAAGISGSSVKTAGFSGSDEELIRKISELQKEIEIEVSKLKTREPEIKQQVKDEFASAPLPEKLSRDDYQNARLLKNILSADKKLFLDYFTAFYINKNNGEKINADGMSVNEFVKQVKSRYASSFDYERMRNNDPSAFSTQLDNDYENAYKYYSDRAVRQRLDALYKEVNGQKKYLRSLQKELSIRRGKTALAKWKKRWPQTKAYIEKNAPASINESLDETYNTCRNLRMDNAPVYNENNNKVIDEWWSGVATLYNSKTGKTQKRIVEVKYMEDNGVVTMVTTLTNDRP